MCIYTKIVFLIFFMLSLISHSASTAQLVYTEKQRKLAQDCKKKKSDFFLFKKGTNFDSLILNCPNFRFCLSEYIGNHENTIKKKKY